MGPISEHLRRVLHGNGGELEHDRMGPSRCDRVGGGSSVTYGGWFESPFRLPASVFVLGLLAKENYYFSASNGFPRTSRKAFWRPLRGAEIRRQIGDEASTVLENTFHPLHFKESKFFPRGSRLHPATLGREENGRSVQCFMPRTSSRVPDSVPLCDRRAQILRERYSVREGRNEWGGHA